MTEKELRSFCTWRIFTVCWIILGLLGTVLLLFNILLVQQKNATISTHKAHISKLEDTIKQQDLQIQRYAGLEKGIKRLQDNLIREATIAHNCLEELAGRN